MAFANDSSTDPSPSQMAVIEAPMGANSVLAVHAGPGSGKTFVIVRRVINWIENGYLKPEEVLVLSMTNKAVDLLRRRLADALGTEIASRITVHTFHSFCLQILDEYGEQILPSFTQPVVVDDTSWKSFADLFLGPTSAASGKKGRKLRPKKLEEMLSSIRMEEITVQEAAETYGVSEEVVQYMINYLSQNGMMRYNDFICEALRLLQMSMDSGNLVPKVHAYKAVVVDEFQDMLPLLLAVINKVVQYPTSNQQLSKLKHLTLVGDPNQCIYEFLGANPEALFNLKVVLPPGYAITEKTITETFRSTPEILAMAAYVCLKPFQPYLAPNNSSEEIISVHPPLYPPIFCPGASLTFIGEEIARLVCQLGGLLRPGDFAVLTRTNRGSEEVTAMMKLMGFKCNLLSSQHPWVNTNLHILIDILSVINNGPGSDFSLMCLLSILDGHSRPQMRISRLVEQYNKWQESHGTSGANELEYYIMQAMDKPETQAFYRNEASYIRVKLFLNEITKARTVLQGDEGPLQVLLSLYRIVECLGLRSYIVEKQDLVTGDGEKPYEDLKSNLNCFFLALCSYYNAYLEMKSSEACNKFPSYISYFLRVNADPEAHFTDDKVNISTVHSAKGLEFPVVFIVDDDITHKRYANYGLKASWTGLMCMRGKKTPFNDDHQSLLQEARVLYVAITRAKLLVYYVSKSLLSPSALRTTHGPCLSSDPMLLKAIADRLARPIPLPAMRSHGVALWERWHARHYSTSTIIQRRRNRNQAACIQDREVGYRGFNIPQATCDKDPRYGRLWYQHQRVRWGSCCRMLGRLKV